MAPKSPALKATGMFTGNPNNTPPVESSLAGAPNYEKPVFKKEETKKNKSYVKKGGKATGNMKDYKLGSQERADEYTARGWAQDATTKVKTGTAKKGTEGKPSIENKITTKPVETRSEQEAIATPKQETSKRATRNFEKTKKMESKIGTAAAAGDAKKTKRLIKRLDRQTVRANKRADRKENRKTRSQRTKETMLVESAGDKLTKKK